MQMTSSKRVRKNRIAPPRFVLQSGALAVVALALAAQSCSQESSAAGTGGMTGATGSGGAVSEVTTGGTTGGQVAGTGGAANGTGGTPAGTGGGDSGTGGGATGGSGAGAGGTGTMAGGGATAIGAACTTQAKGGACLTPTDSCTKTCGPKSATNVSTGAKTETCTAEVYVEGACTFPPGDYGCFKVTAATTACPAATAANGACTISSCMPCSGYADSTGAPKVGYCHCVNSKWSCGSAKEWPCQATGVSTSPGGTGC